MGLTLTFDIGENHWTYEVPMTTASWSHVCVHSHCNLTISQFSKCCHWNILHKCWRYPNPPTMILRWASPLVGALLRMHIAVGSLSGPINLLWARQPDSSCRVGIPTTGNQWLSMTLWVIKMNIICQRLKHKQTDWLTVRQTDEQIDTKTYEQLHTHSHTHIHQHPITTRLPGWVQGITLCLHAPPPCLPVRKGGLRWIPEVSFWGESGCTHTRPGDTPLCVCVCVFSSGNHQSALH